MPVSLRVAAGPGASRAAAVEALEQRRHIGRGERRSVVVDLQLRSPIGDASRHPHQLAVGVVAARVLDEGEHEAVEHGGITGDRSRSEGRLDPARTKPQAGDGRKRLFGRLGQIVGSTRVDRLGPGQVQQRHDETERRSLREVAPESRGAFDPIGLRSQALLGMSGVEPVAGPTGEHVLVEVPDVLVSGRLVALTGRHAGQP